MKTIKRNQEKRRNNERLFEMIKKQAKGITLIALVVTIIVLLILAGVAINLTVGDNGLFKRAQNAADTYAEKSEEELRHLTVLEASAYLEDHEYIDNSTGEEKTIIIPAQCAVSQVEGENTLKDGLVIIDVNGNEWVWVEVPQDIYDNINYNNNGNNKPINSEDYENIEYVMQQYVLTYRDSENKGQTAGTDEWHEGCGLENSQYTQLKQKMLKSVYENHGFYVGRYEVGIAEDNKIRNFETDYTTLHPINETPLIQKNKIIYNWVRLSQAQQLSEKLAVGKKISSLMFGIQWDLIMKYIENNGNFNNNGANKLINQQLIKMDSTKWGNYGDSTFYITNTKARYSENSGATYTQVQSKGYNKTSSNILFTTGATERNRVLNIYDLAGNVYEWTLEKTNDVEISCSLRGGSYRTGGMDNPCSCRYYNRAISSNEYAGFRSTLYI